MARQRLTPELRKGLIRKAAIELACKYGIDFITRDEVAKAAGASVGLITKYYNPFSQLLEEIRPEVQSWIKSQNP